MKIHEYRKKNYKNLGEKEVNAILGYKSMPDNSIKKEIVLQLTDQEISWARIALEVSADYHKEKGRQDRADFLYKLSNIFER